jgi:hypothetical protein
MKQTFKNQQTRLDEHSPDAVTDHDWIQSKLSYLTEVSSWNIDLNFIFSVVFVEMFVSDTPNYELTTGQIGATRSNWTYHTAMAIAQTCKMSNLTCKFETVGKVSRSPGENLGRLDWLDEVSGNAAFPLLAHNHL